MECKVISEQVTLCETVAEAAAEIPVDAELSLPDYCQDIGRILRCRAVPALSVCEPRGDSVHLEGIIKLRCMYADGRGKALRCFEHELPFAADIPAPKLKDYQSASVRADITTGYINCRALSQRKIDVHGVLNARIAAQAAQTADILTGAEGAGIRAHCEKAVVSQFKTRKSTVFTVSESLELGKGNPPVLSLLRSSADIIMSECKPIANKLIVKGEILIGIVYGAGDGGAVESMSYSIPFNQFVDMTGVEEGDDIDISLRVQNMELSPRADADGEYRLIAADTHIAVDAAAYEEREVSVLTDAYSVECELAIERKKLVMEHLAARVDGRCSSSCRLETSREIEKVLDCWCEIGSAASSCREKSAVTKVNAAGCAIVRLADGDLEYLETAMTFESETALPGELVRGRCDAAAAVRGCVCNIAAANRLELKAEIDAIATLREDVIINGVSAVTPDENRPKSTEQLPAVVMYFGEAGEELWTIARENSAGLEDIAADNDIEGDRLEKDKLLLISVK